MTVRSADVADALTMGDDCHAYYDRQADELVWVFGDELAAAEDLPEGADVAEAAERIGELAAACTNPRDSWRASKEFRLQLIKEMSKRSLIYAARRGGADI